jgi:membrane protein implicated in regulation of membrane protease activity
MLQPTRQLMMVSLVHLLLYLVMAPLRQRMLQPTRQLMMVSLVHLLLYLVMAPLRQRMLQPKEKFKEQYNEVLCGAGKQSLDKFYF